MEPRVLFGDEKITAAAFHPTKPWLAAVSKRSGQLFLYDYNEHAVLLAYNVGEALLRRPDVFPVDTDSVTALLGKLGQGMFVDFCDQHKEFFDILRTGAVPSDALRLAGADERAKFSVFGGHRICIGYSHALFLIEVGLWLETGNKIAALTSKDADNKTFTLCRSMGLEGWFCVGCTDGSIVLWDARAHSTVDAVIHVSTPHTKPLATLAVKRMLRQDRDVATEFLVLGGCVSGYVSVTRVTIPLERSVRASAARIWVAKAFESAWDVQFYDSDVMALGAGPSNTSAVVTFDTSSGAETQRTWVDVKRASKPVSFVPLHRGVVALVVAQHAPLLLCGAAPPSPVTFMNNVWFGPKTHVYGSVAHPCDATAASVVLSNGGVVLFSFANSSAVLSIDIKPVKCVVGITTKALIHAADTTYAVSTLSDDTPRVVGHLHGAAAGALTELVPSLDGAFVAAIDSANNVTIFACDVDGVGPPDWQPIPATGARRIIGNQVVWRSGDPVNFAVLDNSSVSIWTVRRLDGNTYSVGCTTETLLCSHPPKRVFGGRWLGLCFSHSFSGEMLQFHCWDSHHSLGNAFPQPVDLVWSSDASLCAFIYSNCVVFMVVRGQAFSALCSLNLANVISATFVQKALVTCTKSGQIDFLFALPALVERVPLSSSNIEELLASQSTSGSVWAHVQLTPPNTQRLLSAHRTDREVHVVTMSRRGETSTVSRQHPLLVCLMDVHASLEPTGELIEMLSPDQIGVLTAFMMRCGWSPDDVVHYPQLQRCMSLPQALDVCSTTAFHGGNHGVENPSAFSCQKPRQPPNPVTQRLPSALHFEVIARSCCGVAEASNRAFVAQQTASLH